jgi:hypothetical protein
MQDKKVISELNIKNKNILSIAVNSSNVFVLERNQKLSVYNNHMFGKLFEVKLMNAVGIYASPDNKSLLIPQIDFFKKIVLKVVSADKTMDVKKIIQTDYIFPRVFGDFLNNEQIYIGRFDTNSVEIWDLLRGKKIQSLHSKVSTDVKKLALNNDSLCVYKSNEKNIEVLNLSTFMFEQKDNFIEKNATRELPRETHSYQLAKIKDAGISIKDKLKNIKSRLFIGYIDTFSILNDQYIIISGGDDFSTGNLLSTDPNKIMIYDLNGTKLAELVGHKS